MANILADPCNGQDPKSALNTFCMKFCRRTISKADIVYTVTKVGDVQQAIVKLHCLEGIEFAGEPASNQKDAEKNAAKQAMLSYAGEVQRLATEPKPKKVKAPKAAGGELSGVTAVNDNPKTKLNEVITRILGRTLVKDDILFNHTQTPMGFQATIQLPGLPGKWSNMAWAGQVGKVKKEAEQSAATIAVEAISGNPEFAAALTKPEKKNPGNTQGGGAAKKQKTEQGAAKAKGEYWGAKERERITPSIVTGTLETWKGHFGWVKLHTPVEHEQAKKNGGKVYLHKKDWKGAKDPEAGKDIYMYVYVDGSGLGGEEARSLV
jgi:dsRNA-specific ribonuclease